ncbi:MAG: hypothetical protein DI539_21490 [Flavobacterium psychrophilum]|nr:MAG: hypothetical protein DI539_21490 [Flavobacterium psychrophilum]
MKRKPKPGDNFDITLYDFETTEYVCANHIDDKYIKSEISRLAKNGKCDYCRKKKNVVPLSEILKIVISGINYLYEDPGDSRYYNKEGVPDMTEILLIFMIYGMIACTWILIMKPFLKIFIII